MHHVQTSSSLCSTSFPMPKFRPATEKNLRAKLIVDKDRKYIIRTMATIVMSFIDRPTMADCAVAAKALVTKYPFLQDRHGKPHVSTGYFVNFSKELSGATGIKMSLSKLSNLHNQNGC